MTTVHLNNLTNTGCLKATLLPERCVDVHTCLRHFLAGGTLPHDDARYLKLSEPEKAAPEELYVT